MSETKVQFSKGIGWSHVYIAVRGHWYVWWYQMHTEGLSSFFTFIFVIFGGKGQICTIFAFKVLDFSWIYSDSEKGNQAMTVVGSISIYLKLLILKNKKLEPRM